MKKKWVLRNCDLNLWLKVTKFNRVCARKQPFSENHVQIGTSVRLEFCSQEVPDTQTDTQTNCSENIPPQRFRGGVKKDDWNSICCLDMSLVDMCLNFIKMTIDIRGSFSFVWWLAFITTFPNDYICIKIRLKTSWNKNIWRKL